jgi:anti-sigma regulatory factor (Ser/Thr protein kinase)
LREIALHLLDIAENSIAAGARNIEITVEEDLQNDRLKAVVQDDGCGMDEQLIACVTDPFVTGRTTRKVGLGIPLLKAAAEACNGSLDIISALGQGTCLKVAFQRSHIDRMPLGDIAGTMLTLVVAYPQIHWVFRYRTDSAEFTFDDEPIKRELDGVSLTEPSILAFIRESLQEGVGNVQQAISTRENELTDHAIAYSRRWQDASSQITRRLKATERRSLGKA